MPSDYDTVHMCITVTSMCLDKQETGGRTDKPTELTFILRLDDTTIVAGPSHRK